MRLTPQTKVIIYGAGYCGALLVELLQENRIQPICVFDRDRQKQSVRVLGVEIAEPQYRQADLVIVALLVKGTVFGSIKSSLMEFGYPEEQIVHIYDLENQGSLFAEQKLVLKPDVSVVESEMEQWAWLEQVLSDEESQQVLCAAKRFLEGDSDVLFPAHPIREQYFAYDIYKQRDDEAVIDCGGFQGDVMRIFLENNEGRFSHYTIIEPDGTYNPFIEANAAGFCRDKIEILNNALSDKSMELYVTNYMNMNSTVSESQTANSVRKVWATTLDQLLADEICSFLKIDIEGYEMKMLRGAERMIMSQKPLVAVAAYHHERDLFEIARALLAYNPAYKLFLRSYMNYQEMVLYAVPEGRLL